MRTLFDGNYIQVVTSDEFPTYEFVREKMGTGNAVVVYPLIKRKSDGVYCAVIRQEVCPPYLFQDESGAKRYYTAITGMVDDDDEDEIAAMFRELKEEAGIIPTAYEIVFHKHLCPMMKVSDIRNDFFVIVVRDYDEVKAEGDGTYFEKQSFSEWVEFGDMPDIIEKENVDWLLVSGYYLLKAFRWKRD